jgi:ribulose-5-phosphate 4-epimerase/fuculose-1-phosphate aldolase
MPGAAANDKRVASRDPSARRERTTPTLISELCRQFYALGWVSGTGGGISIRDPEGVWIAPSGVQKERIDPDDVYLLRDGVWDRVEVLEGPRDPRLRISECQPLFFNAYRSRNAGAVLHSHSVWAVLAARVAGVSSGSDGVPGELSSRRPAAELSSRRPAAEFRSRNLEMQKGLRGHGCFDELRVPIIPNTARESELSASMAEAIDAYPDVDAVIVAGHGIYVWGRDWIEAKTQAECLDFLMRVAVESHRLGLSE